MAGGCLGTQENTGAANRLVPACTPKPTQQPLQPPAGREGCLGGSRGQLYGAPLLRARSLHPLPSVSLPNTSCMRTMGTAGHGLFADSCLLTACPKPCAKQPQMVPALRCFPSPRGFRGKLERGPPTQKVTLGQRSATAARYRSTGGMGRRGMLWDCAVSGPYPKQPKVGGMGGWLCKEERG